MPAAPPPAILVVDDDVRSLELMKLVLGHAGYRVMTEEDPRAAMALLEVQCPAVALVDFVMPGMTGLELCAWVRGVPRLAAMGLVLLTGMDDEETRQRARSTGVDDVVVKPFDRKDLLQRLGALVQR
jgi:DNA-binding response OmpR family regulator